MIGFDWKQYGDLDDVRKRKQFLADFERQYVKHGSVIRDAVDERLKKFSKRHLTFEFFFIPFKSVQEFRNWFMEEVFGEVRK